MFIIATELNMSPATSQYLLGGWTVVVSSLPHPRLSLIRVDNFNHFHSNEQTYSELVRFVAIYYQTIENHRVSSRGDLTHISASILILWMQGTDIFYWSNCGPVANSRTVYKRFRSNDTHVVLHTNWLIVRFFKRYSLEVLLEQRVAEIEMTAN